MNRDTLLIVDDMEVNRAILRSLFENEYNLLEAENGEQAYVLIQQYNLSLAAILLDMVMPVMDGYEVMSKMSEDGYMNNIPVIVITSEGSLENEVRAFDLGAADIIIKPFEPHIIKRRVHNAVELNLHKTNLEEMVEEQANKLRESRDVIMDTLSSIIEHRSAETGQHVLRIRMFTKVLLEDVMTFCLEYKLNEHSINVIAEAASLHDIGKIAIPDTILNKPGRLTSEEFEIMKQHTLKGCEILSGLDRMGDEEYLLYAYNICRYHHERWDGRGYPDHLKGDAIPICAQVVGIADAYDALTTDRVYKKAIPPEEAITMILNGECGMFSPKLLECLKNVREKFYQLTYEYADGHSPKLDNIQTNMSHSLDVLKEPISKLDQMKYFVLLRYTNATVMEVDMDSGVYHLVYQQNNDFQNLKSGSTITSSLHSFINNDVYPDDIPLVQEIFDQDIDKFFNQGLLRKSWQYRILHHNTGEYIWYELTILRVNTENFNIHRALLIWKDIDQDHHHKVSQSEKHQLTAQNLQVGVFQYLNDEMFTILYINEGFIHLFGYSQKEIETKFHNHYLEMIHPDDQKQIRQKFIKKILESNTQELEYRVLTKEKRLIWILDKSHLAIDENGQECLESTLIDITQIKQTQEDLRMTMERYQIIINQTNDIIFEANLENDEIKYSSNWEKKFGYTPVSHDSLKTIERASHLYPKDVQPFIDLAKSIVNGLPYGEIDVRIANIEGRYIWCRFRMTAQFNNQGQPIRVVGLIMDIDDEKRRTQELTQRAQQDSLTKLFNKDTAVTKIQNIIKTMQEFEYYALMMLDLDDFKFINDSYGHMFGDVIISQAAQLLKNIFQDTDIVSRFGGDEFLIFIPYNGDDMFLQEKADRIIKNLLQVHLQDNHQLVLTCSIGISRFPADGKSFQDLFKACDLALYYAKRKGKNQYAYYDEKIMNKFYDVNMSQGMIARTEIESDQNAYNADSTILKTFQLLYGSKDLYASISQIIELIGKQYNVSHVYIFENADDKQNTHIYEWRNHNVLSEKSLLESEAESLLKKEYQNSFDENGIFYCQDIAVLPKEQRELFASQRIKSFLQCEIRDQGKFAGFVGFDDCFNYRLWTQNQIDALSFIAEYLFNFLLKKHAQDQALNAIEDLRMILDMQQSWIYVIDPDTYILKYINAKTLHTVPDAKVGKYCYQAFFKSDTPCQNCPAKNIRLKISQSTEVYNPYLKIWAIVDGSLIRWDNQDACLLACHDVTQYHLDKKK